MLKLEKASQEKPLPAALSRACWLPPSPPPPEDPLGRARRRRVSRAQMSPQPLPAAFPEEPVHHPPLHTGTAVPSFRPSQDDDPAGLRLSTLSSASWSPAPPSGWLHRAICHPLAFLWVPQACGS